MQPANPRNVAVHQDRDLEGALRFATDLVERTPEDAGAILLLALLLLDAGGLARARELLESTLERDPEQPRAWWAIARVFDLLGRMDEAAVAWERVTRFDPAWAVGWRGRGELALRRGEVDEAARSLREVLRLNGPDTALLRLLGHAEEGRSRLQEALTCFRAVARREPGDVGARLQASRVAWRLRRGEEAVSWLVEAQALRPGSDAIAVQLANARLALGRVAEAEPILLRAVEARPWDAVARAGVVRILVRRGEVARAWEVAESHPSGWWDSMDLIAAVASAGIRTGRAAVVLDVARRALESLPDREDRPRLLRARGDAEHALGMHQEAFRSWREAATLLHGPMDPAAVRARADHRIRSFVRPEHRDVVHPLADRPVLLVGPPGSGRALVERILTRHALVRAAGLGLDISELAGAVEHDVQAGTPRAEVLAARWIAALAAGCDGETRVVDRRDQNVWHLGLVSNLVPGTRVIWCQRDPADGALSCFRRASPIRGAWACSLDGLGTGFREINRVLAFWEANAALRVHRVGFEDLMARPDAVVRGLFEFLDLDPVDGTDALGPLSGQDDRGLTDLEGVGWSRPYAAEMLPFRQALTDTDTPARVDELALAR